MRKPIKPVKKSKKEEPQILIRKGVFKKPNNTINKKRRLDVVIVSVNYNDLVLVSLMNNVKIFDNITIVTSSEDKMCQQICKKFGVKCVVTDSMYDSGAKFNRGKAINEGIKSLNDPDYILIIDADIVVKNKINLESLNEDYLYTSDRWICKSYGLYKQWRNGNIELNKIGSNESDKGIGFFQLFNINNKNIDKSKPYPETSNDAAFDDLLFRDKFVNRTKIEENVIIHLGDPYINWSGRVTMRFLTDDEFTELFNKKSTFTICSFYFNYNNDWRQKRNFIKFLEQWKDYYQNMIVGIVDYGDIDFEIPCKKVIIEGDVNKRIWSKEILINKIVSEIDTDYILWIDGDIIYEDLSWLNNLDNVIGDNEFIQLFETINYLGENGEVLESHKSLASGNSDNVDNLLGKGYKPGGSWMTRTKILKSKPLFEKMLVGGGDTILAYGLYGKENGWTLGKVKEGSEEVYELAKKWISDFGKKKVGYLPVTINHLYHGDLKDRNYNERYKNISDNIYNYIFIIPTYNRLEKINYTIDYINSIKGKNLTIIINDGSLDINYEKLKHKKNTIYLKNNDNLGKEGFCITINKLLSEMSKYNFEYGLMMSDDLLFIENFEIKLNKYKKENKILSLCRQNNVKTNWKYEHWIDGVFCAPYKFFKDLNFEIFEIKKPLNKNTSSGVGKQMTERLNILGWTVDYQGSLLIHNDNGESVMHSELRKIEPLTTTHINKEPLVICGISTIFERKNSLEETISSIIDQSDHLIVYQNGYKEIFNFLKNDKIEVISSLDTGIDMGDAGKFYKVDNYKNAYYFSIDDDLIYPPDYVKNTIQNLMNLNNEAIVSYHGKVFDEKKTSYHETKENYRCLDLVIENKKIDFPGTGVMCFHTDYFKLKFSDFDYPNIADIIVGIEIKKHNKNCIVLKHEKNWIRHSNNINFNNTLFIRNKSNDNLNKVFMRRNLPKFCLVTTMWKRTLLTNYVFNYYKDLQKRLRDDVNLIMIACGSEGDISRKIAEDNNFIYLESENFPLSQKHNKLFLKSKDFQPDGVILIGSDDFLSKNAFLKYKELLIQDYDLIGFKDFFLLQEDGTLRYWPGYENYRKGEPIGGGRFYSKKILEKINWKPWGELEVSKSLDYHFYSSVKEGLNQKVINGSDDNGIVFTMRSDTNITKMKNIGLLADDFIIEKQIKPMFELRNFQKKLNNL
jgi:GTP:adenosylcobinamide-phosphate guanylyltransferase